jgi:cyclohexanecarboxylate-CoA ligase
VSSVLGGAPRVPAEQLRSWESAGFRTAENLTRLLEDGARRWPDRPAVITPTGETTFAALAARSSAVARTLVDHGVGPGDVVTWMLGTGPDAVATAAAIWAIGAVSSPIVPVYRVREMTVVVGQVRPRAIITAAPDERRSPTDELDEACAAADVAPALRLVVGGSAPGWTTLDADRAGSLPPAPRTRPDDPCLVLFTSGTESDPKGVVHSVAGIAHELRSTVSQWGLTFRDTMVMASPMTHITGLLQGFMIPSRVGAAALLLDRWDPEQCVDLIERYGATYMAGATPFLRELLAVYRSEGHDRSSLVQYCCGGAAVPPELIRSAQDLDVAAYRAWGMTELPTATLPNELDPIGARAETDGAPAPGVQVRVVDDAEVDVTPGVTGNLLLRGPEMMLGYVRADLNPGAFADGGWFRTGDRGWIDEDGRVRVTGRVKDIINRGGEKLSAREIEEAVQLHPDVENVAVVAVPGGRLGERVGAAVVSRRPDLSVAEVGAAVTSSGLAKQKQPELLLVVDAIPVNATGKVDKAAVRRLLSERDA